VEHLTNGHLNTITRTTICSLYRTRVVNSISAREGIIHGKNYPWKELSMEGITHGRKYPWKELPMEGITYERNYPWKELPMEGIIHGRNYP